MSYIYLSNVIGKIPTVAQLTLSESKLGYNIADGLFYALKIQNDAKEVICIGGGTDIVETHSRAHSLISELDHLPAEPGDEGNIPQADPVTRKWKLVPMPVSHANSDWNATDGPAEILNKPALLKGEPGVDGKDGRNGINGIDGENGTDGANGTTGADGYTPVKGIDYFDGDKGEKGDPGNPADQIQSDWNQTNTTDPGYINNKPVIPGVQVNSDWNSTSGASEILNKPEITSPYDYFRIAASAVKTAAYGSLYNWFVTQDSRGITPVGWRIPTRADWDILMTYLGGANYAGGKMKSIGLTFWNTPNTAATNSSGFSAKGGGTRAFSTGAFSGFKGNVNFWASDSRFAGYGYGYSALSGYEAIYPQETMFYRTGAQIRLIKTNSTNPNTVTDFDGNVYPTVKIGTQVWMASDLFVEHFNNGDAIPFVTDDVQWASLNTPGMCYYLNSRSYSYTESAGADIQINSHDLVNFLATGGIGLAISKAGTTATLTFSINGAILGSLPPDFIKSVSDGLFDLGVTSGVLQVAGYNSKQSSLQHFYLGTANPTVSTRLNLDGRLVTYGFSTVKYQEIIRGEPIYHCQTIGADTIGDWRQYADATGFYTDYCTLGNATKGAGTWVKKNTIPI